MKPRAASRANRKRNDQMLSVASRLASLSPPGRMIYDKPKISWWIIFGLTIWAIPGATKAIVSPHRNIWGRTPV